MKLYCGKAGNAFSQDTVTGYMLQALVAHVACALQREKKKNMLCKNYSESIGKR